MIGGIITSTLLTLVVVPVLYTYLDTLGRRVKAWLTVRRPCRAAAPSPIPCPRSRRRLRKHG